MGLGLWVRAKPLHRADACSRPPRALGLSSSSDCGSWPYCPKNQGKWVL